MVERDGGEMTNNAGYLQDSSKKLCKLQNQIYHNTPSYVYNLSHLSHLSQHGLEFILTHFVDIDFPRKISTRTTEEGQILVNDKPEALARFKQANYLDCRISAYTELDDNPNFIFIDIDGLDFAVIEQALNKFREFKWVPTVLFTGGGYHIYQPITPINLDDISDFAGYKDWNLSKQFLKFAAEYISADTADANHNPSLKSCMVRIPSSINSKNGERVRVVQEWDGMRPSIISLLGIFYSWLSTRKKIAADTNNDNDNNDSNCYRIGSRSTNSINWIETLLQSPLDDYRKNIVNLVLAPYLITIRQLQYEAAFTIIKSWLELCITKRRLDFDSNHLINTAIVNIRKSNYKPMKFDTLRTKNRELYELLSEKMQGGTKLRLKECKN